jgi:predicted transcriptional regulator
MMNRLPDAELAIMKIIWAYSNKTDKNAGITSAQISQKLEGKKDWAATTVLNFLSRLADRGFLNVHKSGKTNIYTPIIDENAYLQLESKSFLERLHGNSFTSLVTALYNGKTISEDDLAELKNFINEKANERAGDSP